MKMFLSKRMLLNYIHIFYFKCIANSLHCLHRFNEKIIYITNNKKYTNEKILQLAEATNLPTKKPSDAFASLQNKKNDCDPSPRLLRKIIKAFIAEMIDTFDPIIHADLNFTDVLCTHL